MIQSVNRFLLDKMATDFRQIAPQAGHMDQVRVMHEEKLMRGGNKCTEQRLGSHDFGTD